METIQIVLLAIVQGFSELLPISSSGHLVLTPIVLAYQAWTYWVFRKRIGTQHIPPQVSITFDNVNAGAK